MATQRDHWLGRQQWGKVEDTAATVLTGGADRENGRCGGGLVPGRGEAGPCSAGSLV
jgi:hypothetical protein